MPSDKVYAALSAIPKAGRGVFASEKIKANGIIERCPVLVLPKKDYRTLKQTGLREYYFMWGKVTVGICFGFGSLYNHSYKPNATYEKYINEQIIEFRAIKNIEKDEEITVNYNYGYPNDNKKLWINSIAPA
ncbi:SET domain-containing protein-lysine N-methyltransferase [Candidatus Roizmanbacteria bacterium]|nr:SET domain-containing protein-lysine N-methyltransferase [Candidatus Roizmanbacteria bacterium]